MKILRVSLIGLLIACISLLSGCNRCSETKSAPHGVGTYEKGPNLSSDNDGKLVAHFIKADDSLFERPNVSNGPWQRIVPKTISLFPQNITQPSKPETTVKSVDVRIVHNGKWLGVMLSWDSSSPQTMTTTGRFSDAAAASFPVGDPSATSPFMGGPGAGVEIIYWKSLWQHDIENGYQDVTAEFPNITADAYYGYKQNPYDSNPASKVPVTEVLKSNEAKEGLPAIALGNSQSQLHREYPVESLLAEGFGTLTTQKNQTARGWGKHEKNKWNIVLTRPLAGHSKDVATLAPGSDSAINFAIWDGSSKDVGAKKNYTMFTPLKIEATK